MDQALTFLLTKIFGGGIESLFAISLIVIGCLLFERHSLVRRLEKKDDKIEQIVDDYHKGNITLADALTSLRVVLAEVKAKIG